MQYVLFCACKTQGPASQILLLLKIHDKRSISFLAEETFQLSDRHQSPGSICINLTPGLFFSTKIHRKY